MDHMRIVSLCHHIRHRVYYVFAQGWLPRSQVTIDTLENRKSNEIFCPKGKFSAKISKISPDCHGHS